MTPPPPNRYRLTYPHSTRQVSAGDLKISLSVTDWPFCDPSSVSSANSNAEVPSTVCYGAFSALETGSFLDATLLVQGPSLAEPVLATQSSSSGNDGHEDIDSTVGAGKRYEMSGGKADATLVMSEWVRTNDYGWTKVIK